jgi:hypothetical protein
VTGTADGAGTIEESASWHRRFAGESFNESWDLLERSGRDADADAELLAAAFASRWHWGRVGTAENRGLGDHQVAKVAAALGLADLSQQFALRALRISEEHGWTGWQRAVCLEGMARAAHVAGDTAGRDGWLERAARALDEIDDPEDRAVVESQLSELPGWRAAGAGS